MRVHTQRGQTMPLAALILVGVTLALTVVVDLGRSADAAARARTAADAAALAGVADGCDTARYLADANGARLASCRRHGATITVEIELDGHRARASAEATVAWIRP